MPLASSTGLIDASQGLTFQEGSGLQFENAIGGPGLTNAGETGTNFLLLADAVSYLLLTTGPDDKLVLAN